MRVGDTAFSSVLQVQPHGCDVQRARYPEGTWERSATVSEVDAGRVGVHGGASSRQASGVVDGEHTAHHDDTKQG